MLEYLAKRITWALFVVWVVVTAVFVLVHAVGDPAASTLGPNAKREQLQTFRKKYGLDQPLWNQYTSYLGITPCVRRNSEAWAPDPESRGYCGIVQGEFGESYMYNEPVTDVIAHRLPRTLLLGAMALGFELILGAGIGIVAARRHNTWLDTGIMAVAFIGISAPTFLSGLLLLNYVAYQAGLFPVGGYGVGPLDHVYHAILPAFTLAIVGAATYARVMRSEMLETLRSDYVRTAHAKGASTFRVIFKHAVRNALLPIVTLMGLSLALLVSGAIITESIFAWPGMGSLALESIHNLDAPTITAVVVIISLTVQAGNLLADIAVAALDPRVRLDDRTR